MANNTDFKISSMNVNGLGNFKKRKDVFNLLREKGHDIYFLQETHIKTELEDYIRASWGYNLWLAGAESNSKGVAILFNSTFEYKLHSITRDPNGCYIGLDVDLMQGRTTIINVYGPSERDNPAFFENIENIIDQLGNERIIIGGDWNCILNMKLDARNYTSTTNRPRTRAKIKDIIANNNLIDVFRDLNPSKRSYTWRKFNTIKQGRLDYFLISDVFMSVIKKSTISPGYRTDHSLVTITLRKSEFKRDRQFWKFNNSLLRDKTYVNQIKTLINDIKRQYAIMLYNTEELDKIPIDDIQFTISDQLFLETLLMEIRGKTISYSSYIKKKDREEEKRLQEKIAGLEEDIENLAENKDDIEDMNSQLQHIREKRIEGIIIRSKAQWLREGEKATRYFCNLENRNFTNKSVSFLDKGNGEIISEQENILEEVHNFYNNLYSFKNVQDINLDHRKTGAVTLNEEENQKLEGEISLTEIATTLKNMKNNKSPGPDGFTTEFFKFFFIDIGQFLRRSFNESFTSGSLPITQYQGVITCIPKEGKPKQFLKNWRPISLLNVTYKILSSCIASRIKKVLPCIIHESQKGFMKGRYIGENIRLIYDTIVVAEKENIPGILLMVDFEKAFDSISWKFIEKSMSFFEFPESIINWFKILYKKTSIVYLLQWTIFEMVQYSPRMSPRRPDISIPIPDLRRDIILND